MIPGRVGWGGFRRLQTLHVELLPPVFTIKDIPATQGVSAALYTQIVLDVSFREKRNVAVRFESLPKEDEINLR